MKFLTAAVALLALASCKEKESKPPTPTKTDPGPTVTKSDVKDAAATHGTPSEAMVWVQEDYGKALTMARERNMPLVIDTWAAWCHTCMEMEKTVLTQAALGDIASEFIWVRIDSERPANAEVIAKYPIAVTPTYYVVDPKDEAILGRQLGGCDNTQFQDLLKNALAARGDQATPKEPADQLLVEATQAAAAGNDEEASRLFAEARKVAPENWPRLPELLLGQLTQLHNKGQHKECAEFAIKSLPLSTEAPAPLGIMAVAAEMCARESKAPLARKVRGAIISAVDICLANDRGGVVERSEAMQMKRYSLDGLGRMDEAIAVAKQEREILDAAAKGAKTPRDAMPFQLIAAEVYAYLGEQADFIPVLEQAAKDLPVEYHVKFLLGQLYYLEERYDDAQQKTERALELSYGPQKGIVYSFLAEVYAAQEDAEKEAVTRKAVLDFYEALPVGQQRKAEQKVAKEALANITGK